MPTFAIADCPPRLALAPAEKNGKAVQTGAISLTVRNTSERAFSGRIPLRPQAGAKPSWFAIAGAPATNAIEIEQDFAGKGTRTITVTVTVDAGEPGGVHLFNIRATSELDPDNDYVDGPAVSFEVPKLEPKVPPPAKPFPWWVVAVALALTVIVGGVLGYEIFVNKPCVLSMPIEEYMKCKQSE